MSDEGPFASWKDQHNATEAVSLAKTLKALTREEHLARRNLNEALSYYASGGWEQQKIKLERLNDLIATLRATHQERLSLKSAAEQQLERILAGNQSITNTESVQERQKRLLKMAPEPTPEENVDPSPLDEFIAAHSPTVRRKRRRSLER